jgi:hypothetical protein
MSSIHQFFRGCKRLLSAGCAAMLAIVGLAAAGSHAAYAIPAFAKKTGLRCSACHEAWPKLNAFGQAFRDNGYQIGNERDSPVYASPLYWPAGVRYTPQWHRELNSAEGHQSGRQRSAAGDNPGLRSLRHRFLVRRPPGQKHLLRRAALVR